MATFVAISGTNPTDSVANLGTKNAVIEWQTYAIIRISTNQPHVLDVDWRYEF